MKWKHSHVWNCCPYFRLSENKKTETDRQTKSRKKGKKESATDVWVWPNSDCTESPTSSKHQTY